MDEYRDIHEVRGGRLPMSQRRVDDTVRRLIEAEEREQVAKDEERSDYRDRMQRLSGG